MTNAVLRTGIVLCACVSAATITCAPKRTGPVASFFPPPLPPPGTSVALPPAAQLTFWFADERPGGGHHDFYRDGARWFEVDARGVVTPYAEVPGDERHLTLEKGDKGQLRTRDTYDIAHGRRAIEFRRRETDAWDYRSAMFPVRRGSGDGWWDRENTFVIRGGNLSGDWIAEDAVVVYDQRRAGTLRRWVATGNIVSFVGDQLVETSFPDENQTQNGHAYNSVNPTGERIFLPFAFYADQTVRRPTADNTWRRDATTAVRLIPESHVRIDVSATLQGVMPRLLREIPPRIDQPFGDFRATFDRVGNPAVSFENGRLVIRVDYQGDIEGPLCHLRPVYPRGTLSTDLVLVQVRGVGWELQPRNTDFDVTLNPGTDTQCSVFPVDVRGLLESVLNSDRVVNRFLSGLNTLAKGISVPIPEIWKTLQGPMVLKRPGESPLCVYGHPQVFRLGMFSGGVASVRFPIFIRTGASAVLAEGDTCGTPDQAYPPPPRQSLTEGLIGVGGGGAVPDSVAIESAIDLSYARITEVLRRSLSGSAADIVDDVHLHGEATTLLVVLRLKVPALSLEYRLVPGLDATAHTITMTVRPTAETLTAAADQQSLVNDLARAIESAFPLDFSTELAAVTAKLSGSYNIPIDSATTGASASTMTLTVGAVRDLPRLILCGPRSLRAYVLLSGPVTAAARF